MHSFRLFERKGIVLEEAAQAEPVRRSEKETHDIEGTEAVHATVPKRSVDPKCFQSIKFIPDAACETSVHDVLTPQQFQDSITTAPPTRSVPKTVIQKCRCRARVCRRQPSKAPGRLMVLAGPSESRTSRP